MSTTTHGSKSKLKWLRYLENYARHISLLLEAITFDPIVGFSNCQVFRKLDIHTFPWIPRLAQSDFGKAFKWSIKVRTAKRVKRTGLLTLTYRPSAPLRAAESARHTLKGCLVSLEFSVWTFSCPKFSPKHIQKPLISHFFYTSRGSVLALIS